MASPVPAFVINGVHCQLREGQSKVFGRSDYRGATEKAQKISKRQFALSVVAGSLWVRSLSTANPTKVLLAGQPPLVLSEGQQGKLHAGDAVLLHALDPLQCIAIVRGQQQEPRQKNQGVEQQQQQQQAGGIQQKKEQGLQQQQLTNGIHQEQRQQQQQQQANFNQQEKNQGLQQQQLQETSNIQRRREQGTDLDQAEGPMPKRARRASASGTEVGAGSRQGAADAVMEEAAAVVSAAVKSRPGSAAVAAAGPLTVSPVGEAAGGVAHRAPKDAAPADLPASGPSSAAAPEPVPPEAGNVNAAAAVAEAVVANAAPAVLAACGPSSSATIPLDPCGAGQQQQQQQSGAAAAGGELGGSHPSQAGPSQAGPSAAEDVPQPAQPSSSEDASGPVALVVLILVGVQGSGKSTFSNRLIGASEQEWVRINQDSINSGKRGNKEMCISAARSALTAGRHVIVDRTNIDPAQRQAFIELARQCGAKAHCVVLRLPLKTCQARAAGREKHEGGLQGKAAYAAVNIMHSNYMKAGPPSEGEGLKTVLMCENDEEVDAALRAWSGYGSAHRDPLGTYFQLAPPKKEPLPEAGAEKKGASGKGKGSGGGSKGPAVKPGGPGSIESFFKKKSGPMAKEGAPAAKEGPRSGKVAQGDVAGSQGTQPGAVVGGTAKEAQGQEQKGKAAAGRGAQGAVRQEAGGLQQAGGSSQQQLQAGSSQPAKPPQQQHGPSQPPQQQQRTPPAPQPSGGRSDGSATKGNALQLMMEKAKEKKSPSAPAHQAAVSVIAAAAAGGPSQPTRHTFPSGAPALRALMDVAAHPERHSSDPAFACDDRCVRISDKYAKARFHALVIARDPRLQGPLDLCRQDIPLVQHMLGRANSEKAWWGLQGVGREWAEQQRLDGGGGRPDFFFGFHSVPSMRQLHLHVISQDLVSAAMKNKKHWNSFSVPFFLHASWALSELEQRGQLDYDLKEKEELLKAPLKCHRCGAGAPNMPQLKSHVAACRSPVRGP